MKINRRKPCKIIWRLNSNNKIKWKSEQLTFSGCFSFYRACTQCSPLIGFYFELIILFFGFFLFIYLFAVLQFQFNVPFHSCFILYLSIFHGYFSLCQDRAQTKYKSLSLPVCVCFGQHIELLSPGVLSFSSFLSVSLCSVWLNWLPTRPNYIKNTIRIRRVDIHTVITLIDFLPLN